MKPSWAPVGDQRALTSQKPWLIVSTRNLMLFISIYPSRVHLEQAPASPYVTLLSLSMDAAALLHK